MAARHTSYDQTAILGGKQQGVQILPVATNWELKVATSQEHGATRPGAQLRLGLSLELVFDRNIW